MLTENCVHVHEESCYSDGVLPAEDEDKKVDACVHACTEDIGCVTKVLECVHEHDKACGYGAAVNGVPYGYVCEICAKPIFNDQIMPIKNGDRGVRLGEDGSEEHPYLLEDAEDLQKFADAVNGDESFDDVYFKLTQDIDLVRSVRRDCGRKWYRSILDAHHHQRKSKPPINW